LSQLIEEGKPALFEVLLHIDFVRLALERTKLAGELEAT